MLETPEFPDSFTAVLKGELSTDRKLQPELAEIKGEYRDRWHYLISHMSWMDIFIFSAIFIYFIQTLKSNF